MIHRSATCTATSTFALSLGFLTHAIRIGPYEASARGLAP